MNENNLIELEKQFDLQMKRDQRKLRLKVMGYIGLVVIVWLAIISIPLIIPQVVFAWFGLSN